MNKLLLCLMLVCLVRTASAQMALDTARGIVGGTVRVPVIVSGGGEVEVRGEVLLGNPTVFYPERFVGTRPGSLLSSRLVRLTDSTWAFELRVRPVDGDTVCVLEGEALAGSDSLCTLTARSLESGGERWPDAQGVVLITSVGTPLPYVRFARLEQNYPNPAVRGERTTWVYSIDKASSVRIVLYDLCGRAVETLDLGKRQKGVHVVPFVPPVHMAAGVYYAWLETSSGYFFQPFFVLP